MEFIASGNGFLDKRYKMKKYVVNLTSNGLKSLAIVLTLFMLLLTIFLLIYIDQIPIYGFLFSFLVTAFCVFATFLCFNHKVVLLKRERILILIALKKVRIPLDEIEFIKVTTENSVDSRKYCFILIKKTNGKIVKTGGLNSILKNHDVEKTENKIVNLLQEIKKL